MNPLTNTKNLQKINQKELELGLSDTNSSWHNGYKDSAWIFVGGLPYDLTEGDIITVFSQYGEIVNINMVRDKITGKQKGYAFICYEDQRSTVLAVDNLNAIKLLNRTLRVDHVMNYKVPEIKGDEDELTKKIRMEGCAPEVKVEKLAKKLKKKEKKEKDKEPEEGVDSKSWKKEIKIEDDSEAAGHLVERPGNDEKIKSPERDADFDRSGRDDHRSRSKDSRRREDGERCHREADDCDKVSIHRRREDKLDCHKESRQNKIKRQADDHSRSPKNRRHRDDDYAESARNWRNNRGNENRSPKSRRHDSHDDDKASELKSAKHKRHHGNDDDDNNDGGYRSSRYRREGEGRRRDRSPQRLRRDRS